MSSDLTVMLPVAAWLRERAAELEGALALGQQERAAAVCAALAGVFNPGEVGYFGILNAVWGYARAVDDQVPTEQAVELIARITAPIHRAVSIASQGQN